MRTRRNHPRGPTLVAVLEEGLRAHYGANLRIRGLEAKPLMAFSTHPIERLYVALDDGRTLRVIFKRIEPGSEPGLGREREVLLYERLLAGGRFGSPQLYASVYDPRAGHYWLFLEDVGDWRLEYSGMGDWLAAFRWLARTHAESYGRAEELRALDCLAEHNGAFFYELWAAAHRQLAERGHPALARFERLGAGLERLVAELLTMPQSLVHGDLSCHNLAVQPERTIRPLDWEWAAIGLPAWDVTRLASGWGDQRQRLLALYCEEFGRHSPTPLDGAIFARSLDACEIFQVCWYLRWWIAACHQPAFVERSLDRMERHWQRLEGRSANG
ncbi:MAG: hypothetical protein OHK0015_52780 [Chloroflexi bacterium OHK40]